MTEKNIIKENILNKLFEEKNQENKYDWGKL
jgi:hypothetical protein